MSTPIPRDKLFATLVKQAEEAVKDDFKASKGIIIILGEDPKKKTPGAKLRIALKSEINNHIQYAWGRQTEIGAFFPEDAEIQHLVKRMSLLTEAHILKNNIVKIIFCVWTKDAAGQLLEVAKHVSNNIIAMKMRILIDESLMEKPSYIHRELLDNLSMTYNNIYQFNFNDVARVIKKGLEIVDAHHEWATNHNAVWACEIPEAEREEDSQK